MRTFLPSFNSLWRGSLALAAVALATAAIPAHADDVVPLQPLKIIAAPLPNYPSGAWAFDAGDWKAPAEALDYAKTKKQALEAESARRYAEALTAWERVLDRTTCTEAQRSEARTHIQALRPNVQPNTDPANAKKWHVLALIYKEVKFSAQRNGKTEHYHKTMTEADYAEIGNRLSAFRDIVFAWSDGRLLLEIDAVVVQEPLTKMSSSGNGFIVDRRNAVPAYQKAARAKPDKKYDTIISYVNHHNGARPHIPSPPFAAATYGICREFRGAGYIMVPYWSNKWPSEPLGEAELHEWLHQIDDVVHRTLGYPKGTTRSSDDGRGEGDNRPGGEEEYRRPSKCNSWIFFYRHLMTEHMTRQIWSELTTSYRSGKPGEVIDIK